MPVMATSAPLVLVTVIVWAALVVPTSWDPKASVAGERVSAGPVPVPVKATLRGVPGALSVIVTAAVRTPAAVGVNVTAMAQDALTARLEPQVVVRAKSALLVPVIVLEVSVSAAVPVLVTVTDWLMLDVPTGWLAKVRLVADSVTAGVPVAVPVSATVCGLPAALSVMATAAVRVPVTVGVNVTETVQEALAARLVPQVVVRAKSPLFVPVTTMLLIVITALPVFVIVTV
jgi:hypothetical protein